MKLGKQVGLGPGHIVLDGDPAPPPQRGTAPNVRPIPVAAKWMHGSRRHLLMEIGLGQGDSVLDGDPALPPHKGDRAPSKFSAHVYSGQTAGRIKMVLGTEVGLGPGHIVLDGDSAPLTQKRGQSPQYLALLLWPNGWMHQDVTWYGGVRQSRRLCVRWRPSSPPQNGHSRAAPQF